MKGLLWACLVGWLMTGCGARSGGVTVTADFPEGATSIVTRVQFDRVQVGMTQEALQAVFGNRPTPRIAHWEPGQTNELVWIRGDKEIRVQLVDDKVTAKSQSGLN